MRIIVNKAVFALRILFRYVNRMGWIFVLIAVGAILGLLGVIMPIVRVIKRRSPMIFVVIGLDLLPFLHIDINSMATIPICFSLAAIASFIGPDLRKSRTSDARQRNPRKAQGSLRAEIDATLVGIEAQFAEGTLTHKEYVAKRKKLLNRLGNQNGDLHT